MIRNAMALFCCALTVCSPVWAQAEGDQPKFTLVVIRGDDAQNNIKKGRATKAVVEVRDRNNRPVAGIAVLFLLPDSGPGGSFVGSAQTATVTSDNLGQAAITYKPNNVTGQFNLKATVKGPNETSINIRQTNSSARGGGLSTTAIVLLTVAGIGLGVGLGVGLTRDGGSTRATTVVLTPGGPVVTPPK